eukprot:4741145-Prymnesium_polylepis.1
MLNSSKRALRAVICEPSRGRLMNVSKPLPRASCEYVTGNGRYAVKGEVRPAVDGHLATLVARSSPTSLCPHRCCAQLHAVMSASDVIMFSGQGIPSGQMAELRRVA